MFLLFCIAQYLNTRQANLNGRVGMFKKYALNILIMALSVVFFFTALEYTVSSFWFSESYGDSCMEDHAEIGYINKKNCTKSTKKPEGEMIEYTFNSCGFRNSDFKCWPDKKIVILSIGDSFAGGAMVDESDMYSSVSQKILKLKGIDVTFVNAGVSGHDLLQYYQNTIRLIDKYKPEIILIGLLPNDLFPDIDLSNLSKRREQYAVLSRQESYEKNNLTQQGSLFLFLKTLLNKFSTTSWAAHHLLSIDSIYYTSYIARSGEDSFLNKKFSKHWDGRVQSASEIIKQMNIKAKSVNSELLVVSIPQRIQALLITEGKSVPGKDPYKLSNLLSSKILKDGIEFTDFLNDLENTENATKYYYTLDGHLTEKGHYLLGEHVAAKVEMLLKKYD
jgi:lysophospholipase L1-like esterase